MVGGAEPPGVDVAGRHCLRPKDVLVGVGPMGSERFVHVSTVSDLAAGLATFEGDRMTYVWFRRPATQVLTSIVVRL